MSSWYYDGNVMQTVKAEIAGNGGYISMDEDVDDDVNEKSP